jgi:hypothetical protein
MLASFGGRKLLLFVVAPLALAALALVGAYLHAGWYGVNVVLRRGGSHWVSVQAEDARLSPAMRLALRASPPEPVPGRFEWTLAAAGFEVAEIPVMVDGREVDRLLLARIDPARFRFVVRNAPTGNKEIGDWQRDLGAALVVNGSYYDRDGNPDTPIVSAGTPAGPPR